MKSKYKSKTLWFNAIMAVAAFFPQLQAVITVENLAVIYSLGNTILRFKTHPGTK